MLIAIATVHPKIRANPSGERCSLRDILESVSGAGRTFNPTGLGKSSRRDDEISPYQLFNGAPGQARLPACRGDDYDYEAGSRSGFEDAQTVFLRARAVGLGRTEGIITEVELVEIAHLVDPCRDRH
jgi:hypothetical protein